MDSSASTMGHLGCLPELFAMDDELNADLAYVYHLLEDDSPPAGAGEGAREPGSTTPWTGSVDSTATRTTHKRRPAHTNPSRDRQRREILELRRQVAVLRAQAHRQAEGVVGMSAWQRSARDQLLAKNESLKENAQLQSAVQDHATFIDHMLQFFQKRPLPLDVTAEAWRDYKLEAHSSLRVAAIHAIADRQYSRQRTAFINAGVFDRADDVIRAAPIPQPDGRVVVERVYHVSLVAPCAWIGDAVWSALNGSGQRDTSLPPGATETYEVLDRCTVYRRFHHSDGDSSAHWNLVFKRYHDHDREVIVWRSVLDDAAVVPPMSSGTVHDESGWLVVAPLSATSCRLTLVLNIVAEPTHDGRLLSTNELVHVSANIVDTFSFVEPPAVPGTFPSAPPKPDAVAFRNTLPFVKRTFVERGKLLEGSLKWAIDAAIQTYQNTRGALELDA